MATHCPLSNSWPLRTFKGTCGKCGKPVKIKSDGKIQRHTQPEKAVAK